MTRLLALMLAGALMLPAAALAEGVTLAPHKAVYGLSLSSSNGSRGAQTVRGRIYYDFSGSACQGYTLKFRQISGVVSEGKSVLTDLRATSWEDGDAKRYRFSSENLTDNAVTESAEGRAERKSKAVDLTLSKPKRRALNLPRSIVFPSEQIRRVVEAARAGKTMLDMPLFDGSETGEKIYDTFILIGKPMRGEVADAGAKVPELAGMPRWPVTISYFERPSDPKKLSDRTPAYVMSFELYENGVSRALMLDYNDFSVRGDLISLQMQKEKPCK
jgi:envelope integrity protein B